MDSPNPFFTPTGGRGRKIDTPRRTDSEFRAPPLPDFTQHEDREQPTQGAGAMPKKKQPSVASSASAASRKRKAELEASRKINDIRRRTIEMTRVHENKIAELNRNALDLEAMIANVEERDPQKMHAEDRQRWTKCQSQLNIINDYIIWHKNEVKRIQESMEYEVNAVYEDAKIDKELIDLEMEQEEEQRLGSDDEYQVRKWDQENHYRLDHRKRDAQQFKTTDQEMKPFQRTTFEHMSPPPAGVPIRTTQTESTDVVNQLVTALGQAFGNNFTSRPQILTKQVDKDLPIFAGKPEDWLVFKNEYERTNAKYAYDDSEKTVRLRKYLKGPGKDAVQHLLVNPHNVERIMEVLEERFGKPKHVLNALIEKVKKLPRPDINKPKTIIDFGTEVDSLVTNIISYNKTDYLNNVQLLKDLVDKLPATMSSEWYRSVIDSTSGDEDLVSFQKWIWKEVRVASERYTPEIQDDESKPKANTRKPSINAASLEGQPACALCGRRNHTIEKCFQFKRLSNDERWKSVKMKKLCFCCLSDDHFTRDCPAIKTCEKDGCTSQHHILLHYPKRPASLQTVNEPNPAMEEEEVSTEENANVGTITTAVRVSAATLPLIPIVIKGPNSSRTIYALLDSGASVSMIEDSVVEAIGLDGPKQPFRFTVFDNEVKEETNSRIVKLSIQGKYEAGNSYKIENVHTVNKLGIPGIKVDIDKLKILHPHLRKMKAKGIVHGAPQMIIGYDNFELFFPRTYLESNDKNAPSAYRGKLGWYVRQKQEGSNTFFGLSKLNEENDYFLHEAMKEFFTTENFGVKRNSETNRSKDDMKALNMMEKHTIKIKKGWETCLLWKDENIMLPESKPMALKRLYNMERKMKADEAFREMCKAKFGDYKSKGYLVPRKQDCDERKRWYLPWFFAYHPTKKPRLVFDGAAKGTNGLSLNDFLLKGPDLLRPLPAVLMRFRMHQVALTADIKEMFHQVKLRSQDMPSQTILYNNDDGILEELEMAVLFFGSASSPSSAIYTKNRNADLFIETHPSAVRATKSDFYMDDFLGGAETDDMALSLQRDLTDIHEEGGFELTKWSSNSDTVLSRIPVHRRSEGALNFAEKSEFSVEKTFGLYWNPHTDTLQFNLDFKKIPEDSKSGKRRPTKRMLASIVMSLFDPLGYVAPLKIKALLLIQEVWRSKIGWDDEIPTNVMDDWKSWLQDLNSVKNISIQRKLTDYGIHEAQSVQLHVFCDASKEAFAAVAYLRFENRKSTSTAFIMGKARVAPIKELSVPRLELQAALLGSRLAKTLKETFDEDLLIHKTFLWTDSMTVLRWVRSASGRFKEFVSNRISEILETTNVADWNWIPTSLNVADDATRSCTHLDLSSTSRWLMGPKFLESGESEWPHEDDDSMMTVNQENLEWRRSPNDANVVAVLVNEVGVTSETEPNELNVPDARNFSSWMRLIRATAARYWACRKFLKQSPNYITQDDIEKATNLLIVNCQNQSFKLEKGLLLKGNPVMKSSKIFKLSPALREGLIVLDSRIKNADVAESVKFPPLLDPSHSYTKLMIKWFHEKSGHFGQERVINELRQHVWILDCRNAVKRVWANCKVCKHRNIQSVPPQMGQLPVARLEPGNPAFFHTGVDYFGPFLVKQGRCLIKRWGVLFTCLTIRAVHLEVAESLDTSDMINALTRFINLRGKPANIWSDNGSNFIGAEREIREALESWNQDELNRCLAVQGINWKFIPPASPHMGGSWERMVGCVKRILYTQLKEQHPKEVVLRTLFAEVVGILNSRPLTHASTDPDDLDCITPNHLLHIKCVVGPSMPGQYSSGDRYRKAWRYTQDLAQNFWKRWSVEYLPWLAQRQKWIAKSMPLAVGDVVIVLEDNAPRNLWKRGIIMEIHPGKDKQVRAVTVKVAHVDPQDRKKLVRFSFLKRPAVKVCKIESSGETSISREEEMSLRA